MSSNTVHFLACDDTWILAVLNSPVAWWFSWRTAQHGKDEALRLFTVFIEQFPIPKPSTAQRELTNALSLRLIEITQSEQATLRTLLDWLKVECGIDKPSMKLQDPMSVDSDALVAEV